MLSKIRAERPDIDIETAKLWVHYLEQLNGCHLFSTVSQELDETKWLQARTAGIGGSEIAAIMGKNPWQSPRQVWLSKTNQFDEPNNFQSEAARWGNLLETTIAEEWAHRNERKWIHIPVSLQSDKYPWMLANIDGFTLSDDGERITGILEIKTTSEHNRSTWENGPIPEYYMCQANWYCEVTGLDNYTIVCLVGGQSLYSYDLPRDKALCEEMVSAAETFWVYNVLTMQEPKATEQDIEALKKAAEEVEEDAPPLIIQDDGIDRLAEAYVTIRTKISELKKVQKDIQAQLYDALQGSTQALTQSYTLKLQKSMRRSCQYDLLEAEFPEAYARCVKVTSSTSLRVK